MNDTLVQRFIQLIGNQTGLCIRAHDRPALIKKIELRIKALRLPSPEEYYQLLRTPSETSDREWKNLTISLTTCETYFFRDRGQFNLLYNQILPELIEAKRKEQSIIGLEKPTLRCWSAGCSTGEEPYTLALILKELLPDLDDWNLLILGTDLNQEVIEKAKQGVYNSWSFRSVGFTLPQRYFYPQKNNLWELDEQIRRMVTFQHGNLVKDNFPDQNSAIYQMDLIFCRNVFVYFEPQAIDRVLEKFYQTLQPGGYLLTAHTELYGRDLSQWQVKVLPESVLYQRKEDLKAKTFSSAYLSTQQIWQSHRTLAEQLNVTQRDSTTVPALSVHQNSHRTRKATIPITRNITNSEASIDSPLIPPNLQSSIHDAIFQESETLFHHHCYNEAIQKAEQVIQMQPHHFDAYYLLAQAYANLGNHQEAKFYCEQAIAVNVFAVIPYYLLAEIAEDRGNIEEAKSLFKRIIYLDPYSILAYLELGSLYQKQGDTKRAQKMWVTALELLKELPPSATVEHRRESKVSELLVYVEKMLALS